MQAVGFKTVQYIPKICGEIIEMKSNDFRTVLELVRDNNKSVLLTLQKAETVVPVQQSSLYSITVDKENADFS